MAVVHDAKYVTALRQLMNCPGKSAGVCLATGRRCKT